MKFIKDRKRRVTANTDIAPEYSDSNAYAVGDYCHKNGQLYKCNTEIASPGESWNSSHWNIVNIAEELGHVDEELLERCPVAPSEDGTYVLKSVVSSGVKTYSWVAET